MSSRSGNRTPGASVTGSNVTNYTNRDTALTSTTIKNIPGGIRTLDLLLRKQAP